MIVPVVPAALVRPDAHALPAWRLFATRCATPLVVPRFSVHSRTFAISTRCRLAAAQRVDAAPPAQPLQLQLPSYFHAMTDDDQREVQRIATALGAYFDHIRFRKGWEAPAFKPDEVRPCFDEAAETVWRIRHALDVRCKRGDAGGAAAAAAGASTPVLRQLDGAAQLWLHTAEATGAFTRSEASNRDEFVRRLVHAMLRDARGYVEGLTEADVDIFFHALRQHRFDPAVHVQSILRELAARHGEVSVRRAELTAEDKLVAEGDAPPSASQQQRRVRPCNRVRRDDDERADEADPARARPRGGGVQVWRLHPAAVAAPANDGVAARRAPAGGRHVRRRPGPAAR